MKWIEVTTNGIKTAIRADQIVKISEYPLGNKNLAKIGILGDTWGVITDDTYEEVVKRATDLPVKTDEVIVLPNQVFIKLP